MIQRLVFNHIEGIPLPSQNFNFFGHDSVVSLLQQMRSESKLHHALLFKGRQGIGKATLAFHLAWNILADTGQNFMHPDSSSPVWSKIRQNAHPGLLYVFRSYDMKAEKFRSAITIEDIRRITRFLQQTASGNGWRIVIIDPADDMNRNAANALLKTLEEPPAKTLFILISHNPGRLPPTIRSRCQPVVFKPLENAEIYQVLSYIAGPIGFDANKPQAEILINCSEGSVRQAILILISDGMKITRTVDDILSASAFPVCDTHRLASVVSARDSAVQFDFFLDYLTGIIAKSAREQAIVGNLAEAEQFSQFWQALQQDMKEVIDYNLDKKQMVIVILQKVYSFLHRI
ncbi:MAG: DNA polymerase III subunit delta' [Candidatus Tokpelaia sp. JSC189]|nr:MAG: DNA polymerase III subunit delta' [Candidatus Tokpelaia sp. JSC189]